MLHRNWLIHISIRYTWRWLFFGIWSQRGAHQKYTLHWQLIHAPHIIFSQPPPVNILLVFWPKQSSNVQFIKVATIFLFYLALGHKNMESYKILSINMYLYVFTMFFPRTRNFQLIFFLNVNDGQATHYYPLKIL